ncbi:hypothetical protein [Abyssisolibacter fermentans]|uniref:hypothetical protein n=1 Tax=Abyssisolibacter fermentans TaxID=1766203 RepID=UPI00083242AE|nr:hypothetical protein [Abyssisolibacter fermentans]
MPKLKKFNLTIVQLYIFLNLFFLVANEYLYEEILIHFEYLSMFLMIASFVYVIFYKNYEQKNFFIVNSCIFLGIIIIFLITFPRYTYKGAKEKIYAELQYENEIISPSFYEPDNNKIPIIGTRIGLDKPRNILIKYDYAICIFNKDTHKIDWYKFNSYNGHYELFKTVDEL